MLRISGPKKKEASDSEEHRIMRRLICCYTLKQIRAIKSRRVGWAGYAARMDKVRNKYKTVVGNVKGRYKFGDFPT
jgi:hypothetical protein